MLTAYSGRCAVSGCNCKDALEAAHIGGYWDEDSNHVQNGLLLRSDLHTLFDLGKIGVDPKTLKFVVSKELMHTDYGKLKGKRLGRPLKPTMCPHAALLQDHLRRWKLQ